MMSVPQLRTRIDELWKEITLQSDVRVLEDLERQRSAAGRQLNSILDRVARLPLELSSHIFSYCPRTYDARNKLLCICHAWSNIALATPSLWSHVYDDDLPPAEFNKMLETWLPRSRNLPLSVFLRRIHERHLSLHRIHERDFAGTVNFLRDQAHRVRVLEITISHPMLEQMQLIFPLSALQSLTIHAVSKQCFSLSRIHGMLRLAPNLVEYTLIGVKFITFLLGSPTDPLTSSSVRHLRIGKTDSLHERSSARILLHLTLPSLWTLCLSEFDIQETELLDFLNRSSPPLRSLQLVFGEHQGPGLSATMVECLKMFPGITDFDVTPSESTWCFFVALGTTPDIIPNLRDLTVRGRIYSEAGYQSVLGFLRHRRGLGLCSFTLFVTDVDGQFFNGVVAGMRELLDAGMHIYVGTPDRAFL